MGQYKIQNYINSYWSNIAKDSIQVKSYNLGFAHGLFQLYKFLKDSGLEDEANCFVKHSCNGDSDIETIFQSLVVLNDEPESRIEHLMSAFDDNKNKDNIAFKQDELDLLSSVMKAIYKDKFK